VSAQPKVRRPSAARPVRPPRPVPLSEGDTIEYGMTVEVKHPRKGSYWPKFGASTTVREGETPEDAAARLKEFVHQQIDAQVIEILS